MIYKIILSTVLIIPLSANATFSNGSSAATAELKNSPEKIIELSKNVTNELAKNGARVAILARMGEPPSKMPKGMRYTHTAFAVYSLIKTNDGRVLPGYAIYNLYQNEGEENKSHLALDYPIDFFSGVSELEAGIIIPSAELQKRLLKTIASDNYKSLHEENYSLIANPYNLGRQNCTEFVLDVLNASIYQNYDKQFLKEVNKKFFEAQNVEVNPFKLLLGSLFTKGVSLSDQQEGQAKTATFETISYYLNKYDIGSKTIYIKN